jgi:hypothetical protein
MKRWLKDGGPEHVTATSAVGLPLRAVVMPREHPRVTIRPPPTLMSIYGTLHVGVILSAHAFGLVSIMARAAERGLVPLLQVLPLVVAWAAVLVLLGRAFLVALHGHVEVTAECDLIVVRTKVGRATVWTEHVAVRDVIAVRCIAT